MTDKIEILELREAQDWGGLMGYYCKGHVDPTVFAHAANHYSGAAEHYDVRWCRPEQVQQVWWRCIPSQYEEGYHEFHHAEPHSRGAFAATVCESVQRSQIIRNKQNIQQWEMARSNGFYKGVNWCMRQLDQFDQDAREELLNRWSARGDGNG